MGNEVIRKVLDFKGAIAKRIRLHYHNCRLFPWNEDDGRFYSTPPFDKNCPCFLRLSFCFLRLSFCFLRLFYELLLKGAIRERIGLHYHNFWLHMFFPPFVASKRFVSQDSVVRNDFKRVLSKQENNIMVIEVKRTKFVTSIFGRRPAKSLWLLKKK